MDKVIRLLPLLAFLMFLSCSSWSKEGQVINCAIEAHGGELYQKVKISFDFRERHYQILKTPGRFEYSRAFTDSSGLVLDVLTNEGFRRTVDGKEISLSEERIRAFSNSVNSVAYFAFLPYGLNDPAARKHWLGETELEGQIYDIIKVTFDEEGGGDDFEDEFLYWVNKENNQMDYLAYSYHTEGGGVRFRKAVNSRMVNGIRIQDYENYMPADKSTPLEEMEALFKSGQLKLLSEIIMENVQVELLEESR